MKRLDIAVILGLASAGAALLYGAFHAPGISFPLIMTAAGAIFECGALAFAIDLVAA